MNAQAIIRRTSPVHMADDLVFGRLGRGGIFNIHDFHLLIGTISDLTATLPAFLSDTQGGDIVISTLKAASNSGVKDWMANGNDIVPFLSPYLGVSYSERPIIPWPNNSSRGMTCTAFRAFEEQLMAYIDRRGPLNHTATCGKLLTLYQLLDHDLNGPNQLWRTPTRDLTAELDRFDSEATQKIFAAFEELDEILSWSLIVRTGRYKDLIAWHLLVLCRPSDDPSTTDSAKMQKLFLALPELSERIQTKWVTSRERDGFDMPDDTEIPSDGVIHDAWIAMFLRAMCWQRLHIVGQPGASTLPAELEESKFPVYIG